MTPAPVARTTLDAALVSLGAADGYSGDDLTNPADAFRVGEVPALATRADGLLPVLEMRVHGVGGAPPADNLETPSTLQVAGDRIAGSYRAWYPGGAVSLEAPVREAYCWGKINYAGFVSALWLLLICFTLVNVAQWSLPGPDSSRRAYASRVVLRLLALMLTVALLATCCDVLVDLLAWQAADTTRGAALWSWLHWYGTWRPGARVAVALYLVLGVLAGLYLLSTRTAKTYERWAAGDGAEDELDWPMSRQSFWRGESTRSVQRRAHVTAGCALVIGVAALPSSHWTVPRIAAVVVAGLFGLAAIGLVVSRAADRVVGAHRRPGTTHTVASATSVTAVAVAVAMSTAQFWWPEYAVVGFLPGDDVLQVAMSLGEITLVLVLCALVVSCRPWRQGADVMGFGLLTPLLALLACTVSTIFSGAVVLSVANLLGKPVPALDDGKLLTPFNALLYVPPTVYAGGSGFLVAVGSALVAVPLLVLVRRKLAHRWYTSASGCPPSDRHSRGVADTYAAAGMRTEGRGGAVRHIAGTWGTVALTDRAALVVALLTLPAAAAVTAHLCVLAADDHWAWLLTLASYGGSAAVFTTLAFITQVRSALTSSRARKRFSFFWDVVTFWPRGSHPFAPPCYAERSVPEVVTRIRRIVGDQARGDHDPARAQQETDDPAGDRRELRERHAAVLLTGYSQGAPICVAIVAQLPKDVRDKIALLTLAAPVRRLYGRAFPAYFGVAQLEKMQSVLTGSDQVVRWRNVVRRSDYIGGWAYRNRLASAAVDVEILDPPALWTDSDPSPPPTHLHSDWFPDPQTHRQAIALRDVLRAHLRASSP